MKDGMYSEYGNTLWYKNGTLHREDGPAIVYSNGNESWWLDGKRHRLNGPAISQMHFQEWWINGKLLPCKTQKEFEQLMKLKALW